MIISLEGYGETTKPHEGLEPGAEKQDFCSFSDVFLLTHPFYSSWPVCGKNKAF